MHGEKGKPRKTEKNEKEELTDEIDGEEHKCR